jgi:hypothetical protein
MLSLAHMKCIPEILFIIVEFPIATLISWAVVCWYTCSGFFSFLFWLLFTPVAFIGGVLIYMWVQSRRESPETRLTGDYTSWIIIKDENLAVWRGQRLPMREAYEWYIRGQVDFSKPLLEVFMHRYELFRFIFTQGHLHEIVYGVLLKAVGKHDASGDAAEIQPVYNLGNDFYYSFLADPMFYSCGVAYESSESLEVAQKRKCGICAELLQIKDGDRILDFGCGWGSWLIYCAQNFDVKCTGMTISKCQLEYAKARLDKHNLNDKVQLLLLDYREVNADVFGQFDKISCFEMSEHVGIRNYQKFMSQVKALLKPDGLFFL